MVSKRQQPNQNVRYRPSPLPLANVEQTNTQQCNNIVFIEEKLTYKSSLRSQTKAYLQVFPSKADKSLPTSLPFEVRQKSHVHEMIETIFIELNLWLPLDAVIFATVIIILQRTSDITRAPIRNKLRREKGIMSKRQQSDQKTKTNLRPPIRHHQCKNTLSLRRASVWPPIKKLY